MNIFDFDYFWLIPMAILTLVALVTSIVIVQPKTAVTITRLGNFNRVAYPGFNLIMPFGIEVADVTVKTNIVSLSSPVQVKTSDNAYVSMPVKLLIQGDDSKIEQAAYNLDSPVEDIMSQVCKDVRAKANTMSMDELFQDRQAIEDSVKSHLSEFVASNGYIIDRVIVDSPDPDDEIQKASNEVIASKRLLEAAKNKAEAAKIERVGEAEADAEALKARAGAFADSRTTIAKGMASAAAVLSNDESMDLTDKDILSVLEGVDHRDMLISCSKSGSTIIVDAQPSHATSAASYTKALS